MKDCLFCNIVSETVPSQNVYEDDNVVAFLDIFPVHPGHTLVVPKKHSTDVFDTPSDVLGHMIRGAKLIAPAVMAATKADGVNLSMNNRSAAGQEVFHIHLHVIPRYENDNQAKWTKNLFKDDAHKDQVAAAIKHELN